MALSGDKILFMRSNSCCALDLLITMMLSKQIATDFPVSGQKTVSMKMTKVKEAFFLPKFKPKLSYASYLVLNAVFGVSF